MPSPAPSPGGLRLEGPVAAPRVALVALGASAVVEGVGRAGGPAR